MDEKIIDVAIEILVKMIRPNIKADDALKFTQSAVNLSHVRAHYRGKTKGAGAS